jgi:hypothetical protein
LSIKPLRSTKNLPNRINIENLEEFSRLMSDDEYQLKPVHPKRESRLKPVNYNLREKPKEY